MADNDNNYKIILPVLCFIGAIYGVVHYLKTFEENSCDMTYMFEYPEYLMVPLNFTVAKKYPRYKLYVYGEGKYAEELRSQRYHGLPALFIPGNAGSHRQVRSLASIALRMKQSRQTSFNLNFFTIDFNEEISALYGGTLNEQTEFVAECIKHIQTLYQKQKKLILIGHSMGGVLAKAVFSLPNFKPSDVSMILTLASPHRKPVIAMDSDIVAFYAKIREAWKYRMKAELRTIPVISIGGGQRDILVRSDLISNSFEHSSPLDIHALTSTIPGVWLSTDHLAIVWCKQLVLTICRSLFDLGGMEDGQMATDESTTKSILDFYYISRVAGHLWSRPFVLPARTFPSSGQWIEQEMTAWRFTRTKVLSTIYILVPLLQKGNVIVVASGLTKGDWIFGCTKLSDSGTKTCAEGDNLSNIGEVIPSRKANVERRMVNFKNGELLDKGYSHVVVYVAPVDSQIEVLGETFNEAQRVKRHKLPPVLERLFSIAPHRIFTISLVDQLMYYNLTISESAGVFEAVEFQVETRLCRAGSVVGQSMVKMTVPWSNEVSYHHIRTSLGGQTSVPVHVHSLPPEGHSDVNLFFILDPECSVVLTARFPLYLMASQFIKFYGTYIIGYTVAFLLVLVSDEMFTFGTLGTSSSVYKMFGNYPSFLTLVLLPSILYHFMWITGSSIAFLPVPDKLGNFYGFFYFTFLRSLLYLIGCGLVICMYTIMELLLKAISLAWIYTRHTNILKTTEVPLEQISKSKIKISMTTLIISCALAAISVGVSSSVATVLATVYYFFKLVSMHTRCKLEEERRGPNIATCRWYFHFTLVFLWISSLMLTSPGLVTWFKNLKFSFKLSNDVYILPCTVMIVSSAFLWQLPSPVINRYRYEVAAVLMQAVAFLTALYGISSVYRLLYFISTSFLIVSIYQTVAYFHGSSLKYD